MSEPRRGPRREAGQRQSAGGGARGGASRGAGRTGAPRPARRQRPPAEPARDVHVPDGVRLQKVLATAGYGSRRKAEELIAEGRVTVDDQIVVELGVRVDPAVNVIHVDGMRVQTDTEKVTLALNKPHGVLSAMSDPQGRPTVADLIKNRDERLFHVGRLDADSEGLLLLTNDGELANRLAHPRYEVPKTYLVTVGGGEVYPRIVKQLLDGVELEDGPARMDKVKVVQALDGLTMVEVVLHEGRNRIVRRMFDAVERPVERLVRTRIGPIALGDQRPGTTRVLGRTEVGSLMAAVEM
ncbi:MFS transporter [Xylanimonas oleitrophica]|uniref:Pseudouridine synthase n=1 Tax=Xylanimonas oleitrophica TaxID=2607479 RepID=A0A2W5YCN9_9MICO|nr:pseudouridine synthase [Xylanimonas oleitrophica]PZR51941.1 MFS transporter [Xylanimonas oleitrophica]